MRRLSSHYNKKNIHRVQNSHGKRPSAGPLQRMPDGLDTPSKTSYPVQFIQMKYHSFKKTRQTLKKCPNMLNEMKIISFFGGFLY